jgi:hypothetical protein
MRRISKKKKKKSLQLQLIYGIKYSENVNDTSKIKYDYNFSHMHEQFIYGINYKDNIRRAYRAYQP